MQDVMNFLAAHAAVLAAVGVAVLDLLFALNKDAEANGILHWVYSFLKGKEAA